MSVDVEQLRPVAEFGVMNEGLLPCSVIAELPQVRTEYDTSELKDLVASIPFSVNNGTLQFELINPLTIAKFTNPDVLGEYLDAYKSYYASDIPDIHQLPIFEGAWYIRINGHRRARAVAELCRRHEVDEADACVISKILEEPSFEQARRNQFLENTYTKLTPDEAAMAIEREYEYRRRLHPDISRGQSIRDTAEFLGYGETKVRDALLYTTMSEEMRAFVGKGLTYTNIVSFARLRDAYYKQSRNSVAADHDTETYFRQAVVKRLQNTSPAKLEAMIEAKIREVNQVADYQQGALLVVAEAEGRQMKRQHVDRMLGDAAVLAAELVAGQLTPEQLSRLEMIITKQQLSRAPLAGDDTTPSLF